MLDALLLPLNYSFFLTALVCGAAIAVAAALVGTHLTLKGFSMIGDGLSHVGFGTIAIAAAAGMAPLAVAIPAVIAAAFLLLRLERRAARADAAIAMLSATALALGVSTVSLSGTNFDLNAYLFGSVLAISREQLPWVLLLCAAVILAYALLYPLFFSLTYDEEFLAVTQRKHTFARSWLASLSAVIVVLGMQSVGALLISALLIFPPSAAMRLCRSFRQSVLFAAAFSLLGVVTGLFVSFYADLPAGAAIVLTDAALYLVCRLAARLKG